MSSEQAGVTVLEENGSLCVRPWGVWTIHQVAFLLEQLEGISLPPSGEILFDLELLKRCDTAGAWLLVRQQQFWSSEGYTVRRKNLSGSCEVLFSELEKRKEAVFSFEPSQPSSGFFSAFLGGVGHLFMGMYEDISNMLRFVHAFLKACFVILRAPRRFYFSSFLFQFERTAVRGVFIISLLSFLIGCVVVQQGIFQLRKLGGEIFVIDLIGILSLREIGVLVTGIMLTGRSGSAIAAEFGAMKMREEIDALRVMGFESMQVLVLPRVFALILAAPVLTLVADVACILGAALISESYGGIPLGIFNSRLQEAISMEYLMVGLIKSPFLGFAIGMVSCIEGFRVRNNTGSLGFHTTMAVVKSLFLIVLLDSLFVVFFSAIGW